MDTAGEARVVKSIRCAVGIHRRVPVETESLLPDHTFRCLRCDGRWYLLLIGGCTPDYSYTRIG